MSGNVAPNVVTNGLVVCLDGANLYSYPSSGTLWSDLTGNRNNFTLINGPTYDTSNGGSILFDGVNDYANITYNPTLFTSKLGLNVAPISLLTCKFSFLVSSKNLLKSPFGSIKK